MTCMGYSLVGLMYNGRQGRMATATYAYRSSDPYINRYFPRSLELWTTCHPQNNTPLPQTPRHERISWLLLVVT